MQQTLLRDLCETMLSGSLCALGGLTPYPVLSALDYFAEVFHDLGFTPSGTYSFRYSDHECMVKIELQRSPDGYYLWAYVQAIDEHEYRIRECADAIGAYVVSGGKKPI